jgi:N-methylhydantoinase B/oxoprolinase/acetone carboxylase alpha subunit
VLELPGGGGFGDVSERDEASQKRDAAEEYVAKD